MQTYSVLYVTGGGYHNYEAQEELLREKLSESLNLEWDRLIGLETYHHERQQRTFKIEPINRYHRVMDDFPETAWVQPTDELYIVTKTYDNLIPLAEAYGPESDAWHPVLWLNTYGNARVVGTAAGHNTDVMQDRVYIDFLVNGLKWALDK